MGSSTTSQIVKVAKVPELWLSALCMVGGFRCSEKAQNLRDFADSLPPDSSGKTYAAMQVDLPEGAGDTLKCYAGLIFGFGCYHAVRAVRGKQEGSGDSF